MIGRMIALVTLGCFCILASFAFGRIQPLHYVNIWRTDKAAQIANLFDISPDDVDKPVDSIFKK